MLFVEAVQDDLSALRLQVDEIQSVDVAAFVTEAGVVAVAGLFNPDRNSVARFRDPCERGRREVLKPSLQGMDNIISGDVWPASVNNWP